MTTKPTIADVVKHIAYQVFVVVCLLVGIAIVIGVIYISFFAGMKVSYAAAPLPPAPPRVDTQNYDAKMLKLAHFADTASTTAAAHLWPAHAVHPQSGAILPYKRVIAYYGNFLSTGMGVLGQYPPNIMIPKLQAAVAEWQAADPATPAIPAIDYIAVTAQGSPGSDGKYRLRMPDSEVDKAIALAQQVHGIVILDVQVGLSTLPQELPLLSNYLQRPEVHLAIDPEFSMHNGHKPGSVIGSMDATDVNYAARFLADLVDQYHLPPKILVVHRFTEDMVTHYKQIKPLPQVQIVMDMDGWGNPAKKIGTYTNVIYDEPVQFTGFKLFYKNDILPPSTRMLSPQEVLKLTPSPVFIQYQ
jgi:hypothetical protein